MKIILFLITASMMITTSLDAMLSFKPKKSPTEKCYDAIESRNAKKVKRAIKKGADVNCILKDAEDDEQNFLQRAIDTRKISIITLLLNASTMDINSYPPKSIPPLHCAIFIGEHTIVELFLNHPKTNINILAPHNRTCLFTAFDSVFPRSNQIAQKLLDKNIDITIPDDTGNTILHHICQNSASSWIELILNHVKNPPLNAQNHIGNTPLHIACQMNATSAIQVMLCNKSLIDVLLCNKAKKSVIDIALEGRYDTITSLFLDKYYKECISIYRNNKRFFDYAIRAGNEKVLQEILPSSYVKGEETHTPLMLASENGHIRIVELLLKQENCNPLQTNSFNQIALHYASKHGHLECVQRLYEYGGLDHQDWAKNTPLHVASISSCINIIDYLVEQEANIPINNANDFVPLLIIYQKKIHDKIKKTTLNHMIQKRDKNNNSLFHLFTEIENKSTNRYDYKNKLTDKFDYDDFLQFLVKKGLNIHARNNNGLTALDIVNNQQLLHFVTSKTTLSFWRVASDNIQYGLFKEILDVLPKDLRIFILILYYKINIETILAKTYTKVPIITDYSVNQKIKQGLQDDPHYFPLLYRQAVLSYE